MACSVRNSPGGVAGLPPLRDECPVARELHHAVVRVVTVAIRPEDVPFVRHHDVARGVEMIRPVTGHARRAEGHQHLARRTEFDHLVASGPLGGACGGDRVGHPHVAVRVHIDPVGPDKHPTPEALHDMAVQVELEDRVQVRIETLVAEPFRGGCITPHHGPDMVATRVCRDAAHRAHLPSVRQLRPAINRTIRIGQGLGDGLGSRAEPNKDSQRDD